MSTAKTWFSDLDTDTILSLASVESLEPASWQKIYHGFPSSSIFLKAKNRDLEAVSLTDGQISALRSRPQQVEAMSRLLDKKQIFIVTLADKSYPPLLKEINDPPLWLFVRGNISCVYRSTLSIVGTQKPTSYALAALEKVLPIDVAKRLCLVSALNYGINKSVHTIAIDSGGRTAAVLAGGLDTIYPINHHRLSENIIENGGVLLSEYPPLSRPKPYRFSFRNRIIAGLSRATLIVEDLIRSDSLTTAKSAINYKRDLFAIPGDITRKLASGGNFLLKHGAQLLDDPTQLIKYFHLEITKAGSTIDKRLARLLDLLTDQALTVDQIVRRSRTDIEIVLGVLTELELSGLIYQPQAGQYRKKSP